MPALTRVVTHGQKISGLGSGAFLLPNVTTELRGEHEEFLSKTCLNAALMPDYWATDRVSLQRFQAEVFGESSPKGELD